MSPVVTALRERPGGRVEVDLDGVRWRLLPVEPVVRAGLAVGRPLDRETARRLGRELRRAEALATAARALRHRDHSRRSLDTRLARTGATASARAEALDALERAGLVDDERTAASRAAALAERGYGDAAIRDRLERDGLQPPAVSSALEGLAPEADRARELLGRSGGGVKALRRLAARGFDQAVLEDLLEFAADGLPRYDPSTAPPDILPAN